MKRDILQTRCAHLLGVCQVLVDCGVKATKGGEWSRQNGWSLPLHPLQLVAWFFLAYFLVMYFAVLVPSCPTGGWQIGLSLVNAAVGIVHVVSHILSVTIDPADANVRAKNIKGPLPQFDRSKHAHVIENQFCYICEVKVENRSKHCSSCNKCIKKFDHHCKWLNNCVGSRNYKYFAICVASALMACLLTFLVSAGLIVAYFAKSSLFNHPAGLFYVFVPVDKTVWLLMVEICAALSLLAIALLSHLLGFHLFLAFKGLSTYDYIVLKRNASFHGGTQAEKRNFFLKWCKHKVNQVSPVQQKASAAQKSDAVDSAGRTSVKIDVPNGHEKSTRGGSLYSRDVQQSNSPSRQRYVLREIHKSRLKVARKNRGGKLMEVSEHGSHAAPIVGLANQQGMTSPARASDLRPKLDSISLAGITSASRSVSQSSLDTDDAVQVPVAANAALSLGTSACGGSLSNLLFSENAVLPASTPGELLIEHHSDLYKESPREARPHVRALPPLAKRLIAPPAAAATTVSSADAEGEVFTLSSQLPETPDGDIQRWAVRSASIPCGKTFQVSADVVTEPR
ncbi:palmitoyltransferase ZDHHC1-like isoform X1 [Dermacentor albipictus]|uniref:palmitoyltransferase ZDHHC1-like isoform X1 n=2 Tax=Dermacentor albipictus TaxID=60249 RepID=UPI0031FC7266